MLSLVANYSQVHICLGKRVYHENQYHGKPTTNSTIHGV